MAWQDGMKNVAATSGTALTFDHLITLKRLTDQIIFVLTMTRQGLKAAERSIDLAQNRDFSVKLLILEDYKDPAEAVKHKPGILNKLAEKAKPAMEFYFDRYLGGNSKSSNHKFQIKRFEKQH